MSKNKSNFKLKDREKPQSQRQLKVSQLISSAVVDCLRKGKRMDIRLISMPLTITKVNISPDLKIANCYFLPFNTILSSDVILEALEESKYVIRQHVTKEINLKYSPEIRFYYDQASENAAEIEDLLKSL
ncbi:MAG: 30S ribosome-binding factor RbfA [Rickettsiaceae bacterium]